MDLKLNPGYPLLGIFYPRKQFGLTALDVKSAITTYMKEAASTDPQDAGQIDSAVWSYLIYSGQGPNDFNMWRRHIHALKDILQLKGVVGVEFVLTSTPNKNDPFYATSEQKGFNWRYIAREHNDKPRRQP